ncbi:MAG: polyprenyl synthetase family protein [Verrucomicrobiota bacterium]
MPEPLAPARRAAAGRRRPAIPRAEARSTSSSPGRCRCSPTVSADLAPLVRRRAPTCCAGGKRLRPAFCYWGWRGGRRAPTTRRRCARPRALELLQACALIHDDVMDGSDTRRGMPAAHRRFADAAPRQRVARLARRPSASARRSCSATSCLSWADELLMACGLPADGAAPGPSRSTTRCAPSSWPGSTSTCSSRPAAAARVDAGAARGALQVAPSTRSSGRCTSAPRWPGRPGAIARPTPRYGLPLGEAFQLRDDVLGVFGDPAETGKPAGDDLREGKRTVLVAEAFERAQSPPQAKSAAPPPGRPGPGRDAASRACGRSSPTPGRWPTSRR